MIQMMTIQRFKSIRSLAMECAKVNVFIGPPDTGKTNILEALYLLSRLGWGLPIDASLRLAPELGFGALFYRQFLDHPIELAIALSPPTASQDTNRLSLRATLVGPHRLFFSGAILRTTRDATLVLDEPDVFAFPPYPKALGEMIAADPSNQFVLTTHNPYLLAAIAEKTSTEQLALFVCSRDRDGSTAAKHLSPEEVARVIEHGSSVFFNLDDFLGR